MKKRVPIAPQPRNKPAATRKALDAFVSNGQPMKRLTFDVPADLHKRIKLACAERGEEMAAAIRRILGESFPS